MALNSLNSTIVMIEESLNFVTMVLEFRNPARNYYRNSKVLAYSDPLLLLAMEKDRNRRLV